MLGWGRTLRRLQEGNLRHACRAAADHLGCNQQIRGFAKVPGEYEKFYEACQQPVRRPTALVTESSEASALETTAAVSTSAGAASVEQSADAVQQQRSAAAVSRWMLPWERRQLDDKPGPLRTWERLYWGVFVGAIALLLFNRLPFRKTSDPAEAEAQKDKEERRLRAARLMLAGQSFNQEEDDDEFEGLSPQEIQTYVNKVLGDNATSDPFEGMSPEEINAMLDSSRSKQAALA